MTVPLIIAEAGVNHNGDLVRAKELIAVAAQAGADVIKFQYFRSETLVAEGTRTAKYQASNTGLQDQATMLRELELKLSDFEILADTCHQNDIEFLCTAFNTEAIPHFVDFGMKRIKMPSGELTNTPMLEEVATYNLPIMLSTGMASLDEVESAVNVLRSSGAGDNITLLQCTSLYPAPADSINLRAMSTMANYFNLPVGFSDHTMDDHASIAAVALGACIIEKHFTLDRALPGPDHKASLEPAELALMVRRLRETALMLGDGIKRPFVDEADTAQIARRSWHTTRELEAGSILTGADVTLRRPASGLLPSHSPVGRRLVAPLQADKPVLESHLEEPGR